jgi:hypothetical protein
MCDQKIDRIAILVITTNYDGSEKIRFLEEFLSVKEQIIRCSQASLYPCQCVDQRLSQAKIK